MGKIDTTYTVEDFISMRSSDEVTYYNFSILEYSNGIEYSISNILYDYIDEISENAIVRELTDIELAKYKYKPYLLAYDMYGATELSFIILALNGMVDDNEFDIQNVKVLTKQNMTSLMGRIFSAETEYINKNRSDIKAAEKLDINNAVGL